MRTEQLYYLCEAAKLGSINAASEKLHLSQQGLNASLKSLEKDIGYTLFTTSRQGIKLTEQGEIVVETAAQILPLVDNMNIALQETIQLPQKLESITIEAPPVVSAYLFPEIFQMLSNKYKDLAISIKENDVLPVIQSVKDGTCDLAIVGIQYHLLERLGLSDILSEDLIFEPLYDYKLTIAASVHHPLTRYKSISLKTALQYPFAMHTHGDIHEDLNYRWLTLYGTPAIKIVTSSREIYFNTLCNGTAIGLFPDVDHQHLKLDQYPGLEDRLRFIPLKDSEALHTVGCLYHKKTSITSTMQLVIDELKAFC